MEVENETRKIISFKKIKANQENGKLGGIKTMEGKIVSSKNAIKHGILSNYITDYDYVDLKHLEESLISEYNIHTVHQQLILEQVLICYVKLSRCSRFEQEAITESLNTKVVGGIDYKLSLSSRIETPKEAIAKLSSVLFEKMSLILTRYEPQLVHRLLSLLKCLKELRDDSNES